ncbi:unnamed protein product [Cyclocybe aegerita]|uniref:Uncharacterized protein n=1 Tax=Cyclocybe aegerita TaxID=1973307 RepID=A0A8S0XN38_CYCAE|nr:unnamed protein product [Cyclocybe aegerita]
MRVIGPIVPARPLVAFLPIDSHHVHHRPSNDVLVLLHGLHELDLVFDLLGHDFRHYDFSVHHDLSVHYDLSLHQGLSINHELSLHCDLSPTALATPIVVVQRHDLGHHPPLRTINSDIMALHTSRTNFAYGCSSQHRCTDAIISLISVTSRHYSSRYTQSRRAILAHTIFANNVLQPDSTAR